MKSVTVKTGEIAAARQDVVLSAILGSCVSVCVYSVDAACGGMNHFLLPTAGDAKPEPGQAWRYGDVSTAALIARIAEVAGCRPQDLRAKVIGGASLDAAPEYARDVGRLNIEVARRTLRDAGVEIVSEDIGGKSGRSVYFYPATGRLRVASGSHPGAEIPAAASLPVARPMQTERKFRVLVIDDSQTVRDMLQALLAASPRLEVVGTAANPIIARGMIGRLKPDVLTLDINMPEMDGLTFLEQQMAQNPMRVLMVTSYSMEDGNQVLRALELGAIDYVQKPKMADLRAAAALLCEKVEAVANARLPASRTQMQRAERSVDKLQSGGLIAIGASTGGTEAIRRVLSSLPAVVPPILIVQHIPALFSRAFAQRLNDLCAFEVKEAVDGDAVLPGRALVAPGGMQMSIERRPGGAFRVRVADEAPVNRHKPSVDVLFDSVAAFVRNDATGILLTGMGTDGAQGLLKMKAAGAFTIAQDENTSTVYGMPKEAARLGAVTQVCPLDQVAAAILKRYKT